MTAVLVIHDQEEALSFCDTIGVIQNGSMQQIGTPEDISMKPQASFLARFLGRTNLIRAVAADYSAEADLGTISVTPHAKGPRLMSLRSEHLTLSRNSVPNGRITSREFRGHDLTYLARVGEPEYLAHK